MGADRCRRERIRNTETQPAETESGQPELIADRVQSSATEDSPADRLQELAARPAIGTGDVAEVSGY